jgi:hypothetical protein
MLLCCAHALSGRGGDKGAGVLRPGEVIVRQEEYTVPVFPPAAAPLAISKKLGVFVYGVSRQLCFIEIKRGVFVKYNELQFHMKYETAQSVFFFQMYL